MEGSKIVDIVRAGGTASIVAAVFPGDDVEQLCALATPELGLPTLPADGSFHSHFGLLDPDGNPIEGDVYKAVRDGDMLTLVHRSRGSA